MAIMGRAATQELVAFMAPVAVQAPAFRDIKAVIINSSLVKGATAAAVGLSKPSEAAE